MKQTDLDRAVARATGETVTQIRKRGFQLVLAGRPPHTYRRHRSSPPRCGGTPR